MWSATYAISVAMIHPAAPHVLKWQRWKTWAALVAIQEVRLRRELLRLLRELVLRPLLQLLLPLLLLLTQRLLHLRRFPAVPPLPLTVPQHPHLLHPMRSGTSNSLPVLVAFVSSATLSSRRLLPPSVC